jgi:hypothetical protein
MNWNKFKLFSLILLALFSPLFSKAQISNVGIIPANIWYSQDPFEDGDKVKIYTVVFNSDHRQLSGTVIFFNHEILLGTQKFTVPPKSMVDVSIDWIASAGNNKIFAKIENARFLISENNYEEVYLAKNQTEESERSIEKKIVIVEEEEEEEENNNTENNESRVSDFIKEKTPAVVSDNVKKTSLFLEDVRLDIKDDLEEKKEIVKKEIKKINSTEKTPEESIKEKNELKKEEVEKESDLKEENTEEKSEAEKNIFTGKTTVKKSPLDESKKTEEIKKKITNPLKQIELFLLNFLYFIISNKVIFYSILVLLTFFIIRFLWRLIF